MQHFLRGTQAGIIMGMAGVRVDTVEMVGLVEIMLATSGTPLVRSFASSRRTVNGAWKTRASPRTWKCRSIPSP